MSVINKMLQDLDRRNAAGAEATPPGRQVKAVAAERHGHEMFWRILAVLVLISLGWVGWVAYQLQPRSIATPLTLAVKPRPGPIVATPAPAPAPAPVVEPAPAPVAPPAPAPVAAPAPAPVQEAKPAAEPPESFKLARSIETPIKPQAAKPAAPKAAAAVKPEPQKVAVAAKGTVNKRAIGKGDEAAEIHFQRAAGFLSQGRVSEAEEQLLAALKADPSHVGARQAYVSLLLEQQRVEAARHALRDAVTANPGHPAFSLALARIHAEQRDYKAALDVMEKAGPIGDSPDFLALRGAVLQRMGRHADAVGAYEKAVQNAPQPGGTWTGLGISLEAVGRKADAAQAYQRALGAGPLAREVREYAEGRIKALQ